MDATSLCFRLLFWPGFAFSIGVPAPISPSLTQDELAPGLGLTYNLSADTARSLLALNNLNYRISRGSWGQWERSTLCSRLKAPHGALTQRWLCPGGCLMSLQLFPPSLGGTSQDTAVQGPAAKQGSRQCQSHRFQGTDASVPQRVLILSVAVRGPFQASLLPN